MLTLTHAACMHMFKYMYYTDTGKDVYFELYVRTIS